MRKFLIAVVILSAAFVCRPASAQDRVDVIKVSSDSLVHFLRKETGEKIFFLKDSEDKALFTVSATRDALLEASFEELKGSGYTVSSYDGAWYVLADRGLVLNMPDDYFKRAGVSEANAELLRYINEQNVVASFQNKVYEVGDRTSAREGKAYVSGYVRDVSSGEPLIGVSVLDDRSGAYAMTDSYGFYKIQLQTGEHSLSFNGYSLEDMLLTVIVHTDGDLDVVMKEKVTSLKGAVISAESLSNHRTARMGLETVRMNVIKKIPSAFGETDVLKAVLTLPGVKSVGEASSGFNVRGGSVDQNLILFNDGTVFNPSHMFGVVSSFNPDVISDVELYKSSIPAEYGGRISSVLDVRGKAGNSSKIAGSLGLGMLMSNAHLEGPIGSNTTFNLGARTTYSNWLLKFIPEGSGYSGGRASFSDINLGISHKINDRNSVHAYGYWSRDRFAFSSDTTFHYSNLNFALKWRSNLSDRTSMTVTGGYDSYANQLDDYSNDYNGYLLDTRVQQFFAKLGFSSVLNDRNTLSYGLNAIRYDLNPGSLSPRNADSKIVARDLARQRGTELALYADETWNVSDKFSLEGGLRLSGFLAEAPAKFYGAPEVRLSGKYSFKDNLSLKAGFNSMSQYIHLMTNTASISPMDTWQLSTASVRPQSGWQAASGLYWTVADNTIDLSLEGYYKQMSNALDYKSGAQLSMNENLVDDLVRTRGRAYGVELMARKNLGKLNGWVSYTWSRSKLQEIEDRGIYTINGGAWYNAPHDKPHDFKLVGNYRFTHRYSISFNVDYSTGRPVTIPVGHYMYGGGVRLAYSDRNGYRVPDYFRMDLAMNIEPSHYLRQLTHMSVVFGVYNITGRKNAYSVYYTTNGGAQVAGYMLSVFATQIPYINLNLKF